MRNISHLTSPQTLRKTLNLNQLKIKSSMSYITCCIIHLVKNMSHLTSRQMIKKTFRAEVTSSKQNHMSRTHM